jgi:all-trans-retinol dehydrogenase (NAD+)
LEEGYEDVEVTIRTNLVASMLPAKELLPEMVKQNHGHVVSLCSMSAMVSPPRIVDYAVSKSGL